MKVGIIGASGYSGEELVRLLARHPGVELAVLTSRQMAGQPASKVFPVLRNRFPGLLITASDASTLASDGDIGLYFLALPHGVSVEYAKPLLEAGKHIIDLSADFRLSSLARYQEFYGEHHAPEMLEAGRYIFPELATPEQLQNPLIASPGCYPTSILMPLIPLARAGLIDPSRIIVSSMSGVSGAGKKVADTYLYCERNESVKAYGIPKHRHLSEVEEQLELAFGNGARVQVQFIPHLVPMTRGIASTMILEPVEGAKPEDAYGAWDKVYAGKPFVGILPSGETPDTADVIYTNRVDFSLTGDARTGRWIVTSCVDNLLKGASGQAVQLMNLKYGFGETSGLEP